MNDKRKQLAISKLLFAAALFINLLFMAYFSSTPYYDGISGSFISTAENLLEGRGLVEQVHNGDTYFYRSVIWQPPFYNLFVFSSFLLFGKSVFIFKIFQILLLSLVPLALYLFSTKRLGEKYALLLAALSIIYLPTIRLSSTVLSEVLFGPLLLLSAMLFLDKRYFLSGIVLGMGALTRDFGMIFLPAFLISLFLAREGAVLKKAIMFTVAFFLVVSPWMLHNYSHYGHFVISAPKIGSGLWQGIAEFDSDGKFGAPWGDEALAKSENATSLSYPNPFERDNMRVEKAMNVIKEEPVWFLSIMARRVPQFLFMSIDGDISKELRVALIQNFDIQRLPSLFVFLVSEKNGLLTLLMWIEQSIAYVFALLGTYFILRKRKKEFYIFPLLIATMFAILVSHVEPRYFTPVNYFVLFVAVYGMKETKILERISRSPLKNKVVKKGYNQEYYGLEDKHWWFAGRRNMILRIIQKFPNSSKILDVGCAGGGLIKNIQSKGYTNISGIDVNSDSVDFCKKKGLKKVYLRDASKTRFKDKSFDVLIASDVLEHCKDDAKTLSEFKRILKPGGYLVLFVPAFMFLWDKHDIESRHYRRYSYKDLKELLSKEQFEIKRNSFWNFIIFFPRAIMSFAANNNKNAAHQFKVPTIVNRFLLSLVNLENMLISKGVKFPLGISIFVLAKKAKSDS